MGKKDIGPRIKRVREAKGMTQEQLALAIGLQKAAIQKIESGYTASITASRIEDIAKALGVNPAYLAGWAASALIAPEGIPAGYQATQAGHDLGEAAKAFLVILESPGLTVLGKQPDSKEVELLAATVRNMASYIERRTVERGGADEWKE